MRSYLHKGAGVVGLTVGGSSGALAASNISDAITDILPLVVELAIVVVMLSLVMNLMKSMRIK
mgnify:CR=1 FL=1